MAYINVNMGEVQPNAGFSAIEKGIYPVVMYASDFKPTSNGSGKLLETHYKVQGGNFHGRDIMISFNWENATLKAQEIGRGQFRNVCDAVNVIPQDTQQLHNIPFNLEVDVTPDGKYNNFVNAYPIVQPNQQQAQPVQQYQPQPNQYPQGQPQYQQPQPGAQGFAQGQPNPQYQQPNQQQPVQQYAPVNQAPVQQYQPQPQQHIAPAGQANPMAAYEQMAQPVQQPMQPQAQPIQQPQSNEEPEWIRNQRLAAQGQQPGPMGNG